MTTNGTDDGEPSDLDELEVRRALRLNVIAGVLGMIFWWTVSPGVVQLFALRLGADNFHIAAINTILLVTLPGQLLSSYLVEKYRSRKPQWMVVSAVSRAMWIPIILMPTFFGSAAPESKLWYLIFVYFVYCALINSTVAPWFSWMTDIVPENRSGQFWGQRFAYISLISVIMLPLIGLFLDWNVFPGDSTTPFIILIAFGLIAGFLDVILHKRIPDPGMVQGEKTIALRKLLAKPLKDKSFRRFLTAVSYHTIAISLYRPFIVVFLKKNFGMSHLQILTLSVAALMGALLVSRMWGFISDNFGIKAVTKILFLGHGFLPLVLFFTTAGMHPTFRLALLYGAWFVDCSFAAGLLVVQQAFFGTSLPRKNRSIYIAAFYSGAGLLAAAAPLLGGLLLKMFGSIDWSFVGPGTTSYHLLFVVGFLLTFPSVFFVSRLTGETVLPSRKVLGQVLFGRVLGISRWVNILNQSSSEKRKLKSLEKIERTRNPVAASSLKIHLEDSSEKVRRKTRQTLETLSVEEEASKVYAMTRRIGDPRTRRAVRRELKNRDTSVKKKAIEKIRMVHMRAA